MRMLPLPCVCSCSLALVVAMVAPAAAEPVQATPAADAATVGLWRFQEGQGDRVACAVNAPAATLHGATWVPGREGFAVATHSGYVTIPDDPALRPEKALTVEIWVKLVQSGGDLICKNRGFLMRLGGSMDARISIDGQWRYVRGRRPISTGRWTHLAVTYDSATKTVAIYIDGALDTKQEISGLTTGLVTQGTAELRIGANDWSPTGSEVDGKIDALRISNVARTFEPLSLPVGEAAPSAGAVPKGNLVPNGDFELGLLGWRLAGEGDANLLWGTDAKDPASGRLCLRTRPGSEGSTDLRDQGSQQALLSRPIPVRPGAHYVLSARMRSDAAGGKASITASATGGGGGGRGGRAGSFSASTDLSTEWKQVSHSFTLPDDWLAPSLCVRIEPPRRGQLWVDDVRLVAGEGESDLTLRDKIGVSPQALRTGNLFFAGRNEQVTLDIVNSDTQAHRVVVQAVVADWDGKLLPPVAVGAFDVPASGAKQASFPIDTSRRGTFRLGFELSSEGQTWRQGAELKYAVIVPLKGVGNVEDSIFAMNTHMEREPTAHLKRNMEVLSECGVKWIRGWWGWGMCEKERGKFDWTEYDRQLATVEGADMRLMPILLRYYPQYEQAWAGALTGIQRPPYKMEEWGAFVRKVAERYKGRVTAWEVWNEPTMSGAGFSAQQYADLLRATATPMRELDPKAKIVGFAGVPLTFMRATLALGVSPTMDVIGEHSYAQIERPEANLPKQTEAVRAILAAHGGDKPIWHTEQGVRGDDDGYLAPSLSEGDVAALYTRNLVTSHSLGIGKYFWFSAQTSPTYGWAVFYENYIPRPRLAALNACASFLEGAAYRRTCHPGKNAYAHLFEGSAPVCVVWNMNLPARLSLPMRPDAIQVFDLMGTPVPAVAEKDGVVVQLPTERPVYLRCAAGEYGLLEKALAGAQVVDLVPVAVAARQTAGGVEVTVTSQSKTAQDGIVDIVRPVGATQDVWPAPQYFHSLSPGGSRSFTFALPAKGASEVRARVGDREMREVKTVYPVADG